MHEHGPALHGHRIARDADRRVVGVGSRGDVPAPGVPGTDRVAALQISLAQRPTAVDASERLRWIADKPKRRLRALAIAAVLTIAVLGGIKYAVDLARGADMLEPLRDSWNELAGMTGLVSMSTAELRAAV